MLLYTWVVSVCLTSCRVIHTPLHYKTNLQDKVKPPQEKPLGWFGNDLSIANQVREEPAITTYFAPPNESFEFTVMADYVVQELGDLERLLVNPISVSPVDKLQLSKLVLNVNHHPLIEVSDFGSDFNEDEAFTQTLPNLKVPAVAGETDHYEFIGYWIDGKNRTLAQGIWIDVTAKASDSLKSNKNPLAAERTRLPDIVKLQGGVTLATKGGKSEYSYGDHIKHPLKPGLTLGALVPFQFSPRFSIEAGLQLANKGHIEKYTYENDYSPDQGDFAAVTAMLASNNFRQQTRLIYVGMPVMINLFPAPKLPDLGFALGLQPSFLLGRKTRTNAFGSTTTEKGTAGYHSWDTGLLFGASYQLSEELGLVLAYEHGLADIYESTFDHYKNRTVKFMATYKLPLH